VKVSKRSQVCPLPTESSPFSANAELVLCLGLSLLHFCYNYFQACFLKGIAIKYILLIWYFRVHQSPVWLTLITKKKQNKDWYFHTYINFEYHVAGGWDWWGFPQNSQTTVGSVNAPSLTCFWGNCSLEYIQGYKAKNWMNPDFFTPVCNSLRAPFHTKFSFIHNILLCNLMTLFLNFFFVVLGCELRTSCWEGRARFTLLPAGRG
jgi:hypothetical protein